MEIKVQSQAANVGSELAFNLNPWIPLPEGMKMVLRWDLGMTFSDLGIYGTHAIFAKDYNEVSGAYSCINSWGLVHPEPTISRSRIYAVDYISVIQI